MRACIEGSVDTLGHRWILGSESTNLTMRCEVCGLYVQQVLLQDRFDKLMQHPCKDQPSTVPAEWNIHPSHKMLNLGVCWVCLTCEKLQRPVSVEVAKPLKEPCKGPPKKSGHHAKQAHVNQKTLTHKPVAALDKTQARIAFGAKVKPKPDKNDGDEPPVQDTPEAKLCNKEARPGLKQTTLFFGQ